MHDLFGVKPNIKGARKGNFMRYLFGIFLGVKIEIKKNLGVTPKGGATLRGSLRSVLRTPSGPPGS